MKYVIIIPDGAADEPQESLVGKTPLQAAKLPNMDAIATAGIVGYANNVPKHLPAGSAVANMSLLGYDPNEFFTGRAPLEAAAQGIELGPDDWAIRCNLVSIDNQIMKSFTAGHSSSEEAKELWADLQKATPESELEFIPGVSYRNLLLYRGTPEKRAPFSMETRATPPHDLTDKSVGEDFPRGAGSDFLNDLMSRSLEVFQNHPVNNARIHANKLPATNIWLWGFGRTPQLPSFEKLHGLRGKMITAVDLLRGIASLIGWERVEVEGATGYTDTDYQAKGQACVDHLDSADIICVHIEAPDEASHEGDVTAKIKALEAIDRDIVGPVWKKLKSLGDYRILVTPDHPTPVRTKTHSHGFVPFTMAGTELIPDEHTTYDEPTAGQGLAKPQGNELMNHFILK